MPRPRRVRALDRRDEKDQAEESRSAAETEEQVVPTGRRSHCEALPQATNLDHWGAPGTGFGLGAAGFGAAGVGWGVGAAAGCGAAAWSLRTWFTMAHRSMGSKTLSPYLGMSPRPYRIML